MAKAHIGTSKDKLVSFELNDLTRHCVVLGTTGSGKTVMGKVLMEEAMQKGIPIIAIDPKGDIGGLGVADSGFDFRPFLGQGVKKAENTAKMYLENLKKQGMKKEGVQKLKNSKVKIYTPKSTSGVSVSLLPDLGAPKNFKKLSGDDPNFIADFVEPVSASVLQLAGVSGAKREKSQSLISSILVHFWNDQRDMSIEQLIEEIIAPPFDEIGSLSLEDFMNELERKKLASSINLLLSSPAKRAWKHGEKLDMQQMMKKGSVSVFDLRFTISSEEKQFVAEQIMQELYKFLINKGGSSRLKYIFYIDELAGLLPPPPANPPSKKLLELLIRQARAFGLGIIVATQSPGDIDYRIIGNIGTRFIGRLRTERDMEKVATAMDTSPSGLKGSIGKLGTGDFIYNNAVKNVDKIIHARWLLTYHGGPLKGSQISWVNDPKTRPKVAGKLKVDLSRGLASSKRDKGAGKKPAKRTYTSAKSLVNSVIRTKKAKKTKKKVGASKPIKGKAVLSRIIHQVKSHSDKVQLKVALVEKTEFVAHLRVVVEPKNVKQLDFDLQGPFVFDLTSRLIPLTNYLKNISWSYQVPDDVVIAKPKRSVKQAVNYAIREAKANLKTPYYSSTVVSLNSLERDEVENKNYAYLLHQTKPRIRQLEEKAGKKVSEINAKIRKANDKIRKYGAKVKAQKASRMVKRVFTNKKLSKSTLEMREYEKRARNLERIVKTLKMQLKRVKDKLQDQKKALKDKAFVKSHTCVKRLSYNPSRRDLVVHSTILLVPKRKSEV